MRHQIHICSVATRSGEPHNALHSSSNYVSFNWSNFLTSNLREWSNSLVFKAHQQMLPLVESLLTITLSHVVGCGNGEQSTIQYSFLLAAHGIVTVLELPVFGS